MRYIIASFPVTWSVTGFIGGLWWNWVNNLFFFLLLPISSVSQATFWCWFSKHKSYICFKGGSVQKQVVCRMRDNTSVCSAHPPELHFRISGLLFDHIISLPMLKTGLAVELDSTRPLKVGCGIRQQDVSSRFTTKHMPIGATLKWPEMWVNGVHRWTGIPFKVYFCSTEPDQHPEHSHCLHRLVFFIKCILVLGF